MAIEKFFITAGDLNPPYPFKVIDALGNPVSLAGATIYVTMVSGQGAVKINNRNTGIVITDADAGEGEYQWQAGDTESPGLYQIEFRVVPAAGGSFTVPRGNEGEAEVEILNRLGT